MPKILKLAILKWVKSIKAIGNDIAQLRAVTIPAVDIGLMFLFSFLANTLKQASPSTARRDKIVPRSSPDVREILILFARYAINRPDTAKKTPIFSR